MKTVILINMGILFLSLSGCVNSTSSNDSTETNPAETPFAVAKSAAERVTSTPAQGVMDEQAASINAFAVAMYMHLAKADGNIFFSPYSITSALGMAEAGARGATAQQIRDALSVTLQGDDFHAAINGLDHLLMGHAQSTEGLTLNVVNSSWIQSGWEFNLSYLDFLGRYYGAGANLLDFFSEPEPSRITINTWVAQQTNQKIKDLIPQGVISSATTLVLTNAIYFLADWYFQFDASLTQDKPFNKLDNQSVKAPLMQLGKNDEKVQMEYTQASGIRSINLPYKGNRLCMTILLPDSGAYRPFEDALAVDNINTLVGAMDSTKLPPVRLPRFKFTTGSISLVPALKSLGMTDAFIGDKADFSGIDGKKDLVVSDVIHKAFIAVDEMGTEAAAATAVIIEKTSYGNPPRFIADRPFIYLIRDRDTGVILFMGRVLDPTME